MLEHGYIGPWRSPHGALGLFATKKNAGILSPLVHKDHRCFYENGGSATVIDCRARGMCDHLDVSEVFNKVDLIATYWKIQLWEVDMTERHSKLVEGSIRVLYFQLESLMES